MKLIVGLGNPGILYQATRHNIGFNVLKGLARRFKVSFKKDRFTLALSAKIRIGAHPVLLAMPLTFMNLSGQAVTVLLDKYKIKPLDLLVVSDDLDLEFGRIKLNSSGSSAGHRGIKSIIEFVGSNNFCRLRIGIGRENSDPADYCLRPFNRKEKTELTQILSRAADCCKSWATKGIDQTMNIFNAKVKKHSPLERTSRGHHE